MMKVWCVLLACLLPSLDVSIAAERAVVTKDALVAALRAYEGRFSSAKATYRVLRRNVGDAEAWVFWQWAWQTRHGMHRLDGKNVSGQDQTVIYDGQKTTSTLS